MAEGASGEYRTLSERLEAEKFRAGQYEAVPVATPGVVDIHDLIPEAVPAVSVRKDAWDNVYLRGAVMVDFDTLVSEDAIDYSGESQQPGSFVLFTIPEDYRPPVQDGYSVTIAVQNDDVTYNIASFLRVGTDGAVTAAVGGSLADGVTATATALAGATLSIILAGDFSLN